MKTFEIHYSGFKFIKAETLREANEKMEKEHPDLATTMFYDCDEKKEHEVIGHCEISGLSIFEGDKFSHDHDGIMWLDETEN